MKNLKFLNFSSNNSNSIEKELENRFDIIEKRIPKEKLKIIEKYCNKFKYINIEVSNLFKDHKKVNGLIEFGIIEICIKFPINLFENDDDFINYVICHEIGHLYQYSLGINNSKIIHPTQPICMLSYDGKNYLYLDINGDVWGDSEDIENDANRFANLCGFKKIEKCNNKSDITLNGEFKIQYFSNEIIEQSYCRVDQIVDKINFESDNLYIEIIGPASALHNNNTNAAQQGDAPEPESDFNQ